MPAAPSSSSRRLSLSKRASSATKVGSVSVKSLVWRDGSSIKHLDQSPSTPSYKPAGSLRASPEVATKKRQVEALPECPIRDTPTPDSPGDVLNDNTLMLGSREEKDETENPQTIETLKMLLEEERFEV